MSVAVGRPNGGRERGLNTQGIAKMSPSLAVVAAQPAHEIHTRVENISERVRQLQAEAKSLAREHIMALEGALFQVERLASEIADGGEAYPPGVRDIARRLAEDCESRVQTLEAITKRS